MTDLYVSGPDALKLLSDLGVNSFKTFKVDQAKQIVVLQPARPRDRRRDPVLPRRPVVQHRRPPAGGQLGAVPRRDAAGTTRRRSATSARRRTRAAAGRSASRSRAPTRVKVMEAVTGGPVPDIKFFHMDAFPIAGLQVRALRHGMVGQPGWELFGPWEQGDQVRDALLRGGQGVRHPPGGRAHLSDQHDRVGLDSVAGAGRLHRRRHEAVPRVAEADELRGHGVARRQLHVGEHRGLLPDAARAGLRLDREVRSRLRRPRGARGDARAARARR